MIIPIKLTPSNNRLVGAYPKSEGDTMDHVLVELVGAVPFSVPLPDMKASQGRAFLFKNLGTANVTLITNSHEIIDYPGIYTKVLVPKEYYELAPNNVDKWISLQTSL
jgi:hypothetical protein